MNFSGISDRTLWGRFLRLPLRFIPAGMTMPILQGKLRGKKWIAGSSSHGCWLGSYEYEKRLAFEEIVGKGDIVFDIGANVGFYTLLASVLVEPNGGVFAFEPVPRNLLYLKKHLRTNRTPNVTVIEAAVTDRGGVTYFRESTISSMGRIALEGNLQVKTVSLDELISAGEIPTPDHIKIDVEGAEMRVLCGAKSMLADAHPTLFLATHGCEIHQQCCRFLERLDYELRPIVGRSLEKSDEILALRRRRL